MDAAQLREIVRRVQSLSRRVRVDGPQTDDELHAWIWKNLKVNVPRVAVCEDHQAPFQFLADLYFERVGSALALANRGGAKTFLVAILHFINSTFKPGAESLSFGATLGQSTRCYSHIESWCYVRDPKTGKKTDVIQDFLDGEPKKSETSWKTGSRIEIVAGCLPRYAKVITEDGPMKIGDIVNQKLSVKVKSYNYDTQGWEWQPVVDWHNNGKTEKWMRVVIQNGGQGTSHLSATSGHKIMTPNGKKKHLGKFKPGDAMCVPGEILSYEQQQIMIGTLMGDGHVSPAGVMRADHSAHQRDYLYWQGDSFVEFDPCYNDRAAKNTESFRLRCSRVFHDLRREWYPAGEKRVPSRAWREMGSLALACWLMDDGTWTRTDKGGTWTIATHNLTAEERAQADVFFQRIGVWGTWLCQNVDKDQYVWRCASECGPALQAIVSDYIDISEKQPKGYKQWIAGPIEEHSMHGLMTAEVVDIYETTIPLDGNAVRYDITVAKNHNYCVQSGILISNTATAVNGPHPCSISGSQILTKDGYKNVEDLDPEVDSLASFTRAGNSPRWSWLNNRKRESFPFTISNHLVDENIIVLTDENGTQCKVTSNHVLRAKLKPEYKDRHIVYLMRKENWWRIGKTTGRALIRRMNEESADDIWILKTFANHVEAIEFECCMQSKYGITSVCFAPYKHTNSRVADASAIHMFLEGESELRALYLLEDFDMHIEFPFFSCTKAGKGAKGRKLSTYWFDTCAGNLVALDGLIWVPAVSESFEYGNYDPNVLHIEVDVNKEHYCGEVYSLEVYPFHYYVSDGIVVHNSKAHADEIELMDEGTWVESRGLAVAKAASGPLPEFMKKFNGVIPPQDIVTSTRKSMRGRMQKLLEEIAEDVAGGNIAELILFQWCVWETIGEVPECRCIDKSVRQARLKELDRNPEDLCPCDRVIKGRMKDGSPRTLEKTCGGKAFHSRGWKPLVDLVSTFKRNTPGTWTLQHECREAIDENNYIQNWSLDSYGVKNWEPKPEYGPVYQGIDWGGRNAYCSLWFQYLNTEVSCYDHEYNSIFLSAGTYVLFKEIYAAGIDTGKFASRVQMIENSYRAQYGPRWNVKGRFMDPQGRGDRNLFARKGMKGAWPVITRNKEQMIAVVQNLVIDDRLAVDSDGAPMWCEEVEVWQKDEKTGNEIDNFNHAMASFRYCIANAEVLEGTKATNAGRRAGRAEKTKATKNFSTLHLEKDGPVAFSGGKSHATDQFRMTR